MRAAALLFFVPFVLSGCGLVNGLVADKIIADQEKVQSFDAVYSERGTIPQDPGAVVKIHMRYEAPSNFSSEVIAPEDYAGDVFAYVGKDMWFYSRFGNYGIHVKNVVWDQERWRAAIRESVKINRDAYDYQADEQTDTVANRVASVWSIKPLEEGELLLPGRLWLDDEFTIPLRIELGSLYGSRMEKIVFNRPHDPIVFEPRENAVWFEFDMAAPSLSHEEAEHFADFPLLEPRGENPYTRTQILRSGNESLPVVSFVYERGPFVASVTETMDRGYVDPGLRGILVDLGDTKGRLSFAGASTVIVFVRKGVAVSILTNLPSQEAVRFARSLAR